MSYWASSNDSTDYEQYMFSVSSGSYHSSTTASPGGNAGGCTANSGGYTANPGAGGCVPNSGGYADANTTTHGPYINISLPPLPSGDYGSFGSTNHGSNDSSLFFESNSVTEEPYGGPRTNAMSIPRQPAPNPVDLFDVGNPDANPSIPSFYQEQGHLAMNDRMTADFHRMFTDLTVEDNAAHVFVSSTDSDSSYHSNPGNTTGRSMMVLPPRSSTTVTRQPASSRNELTPLIENSEETPSSTCCRICPC